MRHGGRRHVLFILPTLTGGGAERVIVTLLRHLDRGVFRPTLAVVSMQDAVYRDEVPADVELIDLKGTRVRSTLWSIIRLVWRLRPNVVFSSVGHLNLALAMIRPLLPNSVRYIGRQAALASENLQDERYPGLWSRAFTRFYPRFDALVCQSQSMREDIVSRFAFPIEKTVMIHNPVEVERIRELAAESIPTGMQSVRSDESGNAGYSGNTLELVAAGRLSHEKGFDLLIEAIALAADCDCRLTLLGDGPLRAELEALARGRGVAERVRFVGFQKNPYPFFAQAHAFVLSSRWDAFPNAVLEALACGTPVIAFPAPGGIGEIAAMSGGVQFASEVSAKALCAELSRFSTEGTRATPISMASFVTQRIVCQYQNLLAEGMRLEPVPS